MKRPRHKWHTVPAPEEAQLLFVLPPYPQVVLQPLHLQKCERCDWYRLEDRSPRGAQDWWFFRLGQRRFGWSSYYVTGRPHCGEEK